MGLGVRCSALSLVPGRRVDVGSVARMTLVSVLFFSLLTSGATADDEPKGCDSKPYVVKIHAD